MACRWIFAVLAWLCLAWSMQGQAASSLPLLSEEAGRPLQPAVEQWQDISQNATLTDALTQGHFTPVRVAQLTPGYSDSAFWLRTRLHNSGPYPQTVWLELGTARLQEVDFYQWKDSAWHKARAGTLLPFASRPLDTTTPVFPVTLAPGETRPIIWRIASQTAISMVPKLWSPESFRNNEAQGRLVIGLELGALTIIGLYSLMLFCSLGQRGFGFYAASVLTYVVYEASINGLGFHYLWPDSPGWATRVISLSVNVSQACTLQLFRDFLQTRHNMPRWDHFLRLLLAALMLSTLLSQFIDYRIGAQFGTFLSFVITAVIPLFCVWSLVRGPTTSWAYALATVAVSLGNLPRVFEILGLRPPDAMSAYGSPIASIFCTFLLLIAFMHQMRRVRQQKDRATASLLAFREKEREELELLVTARTNDLKAALAQAQSANHAKSALLAHISHDLRAPLSTIIGYARLLLHSDADLQQCRQAIEKNAIHQLELIDELIDFSRGELGEVTISPRPGYWHSFIDEIARDTRQLVLPHDNHFVLDSAINVPPVLCTDFKRLRQILSNLISNAAKFTHNGTIRLAIQRCDDGSAPQHVILGFEVHDTGIGMSPDTLSCLFQPFKRGDNANEYEGTGLGLVIARSLVRKLGGELTVTSQVGEGSRFAFALNIEVQEEATLLAAMRPSSAPLNLARRNHTILVVDDVPESLALTVHWLRTTGHNVLEASDGDKALWLLDRHMVNVVVSDQRMPNRDGWELLRAIREMPVPLPVLLYSAEPAIRPSVYPNELCFDAELLKPADPNRLLDMIDALLSRPTQKKLRPSAQHLAALRELVVTGRISDIEVWAQKLEQDSPRHIDFARQVRRAARELDVETLACCAKTSMPLHAANEIQC